MALRSIAFAFLCVTSLIVLSAGCSFGQNATDADAADGQDLFGNVGTDNDVDTDNQDLFGDADTDDQDLFGPIEADASETDELAAEVPAADDEEDIFAGIDEVEPAPAESVRDAMAEEAAADPQEPFEFPQNPNPAAASHAEVHQLRERVAAVRTEVEELKTMLNSLQKALARAQDPSDFSTRALGAMSEDADLRSTMGQMLQGKVRLANNTGQDQVLYINGTPWTVVTGESFVFAPVGRVSFSDDTASTPIFKDSQEWRVNESTGQMELEFVLGDADAVTERSVLKQLP